MDSSQPNPINSPSHSTSQDNIPPPQGQSPEFFSFLQSTEEKHSRDPSFFSEKGLSQDIIQVTGAESDVCLEVFYALYHVLWPQIEKQSDVSFKDAWTRFIGGSIFKGILCPPEKLITEKRVRDIKRSFSEGIEGENQIFQDLDGVLNAILNLKQKVGDYSTEGIASKQEILASLDLVHGFYLRFRNQVKVFVQAILEKERINASSVAESDALEDLLEPKAIMMGDLFTHHWAYRLSRSKAQKLLSLDSSGRNIKSNPSDPSNHRVTALPDKSTEPLVFFKANGNPPIQPEKEFMLYSLYQHFQIPVPETGLLILTDVFEANPDYFYAVQPSEAVLGESPLKAYRNEETIFEEEAYALQTIGAFLTNPSDGSFKNFKYSPLYQTFISIDNDLVFKPELAGKEDKKIVNVKSMLYLLPQIDLPIPETTKTFFASLDPHLTILSWLQDLSKKNRGYSDLFTKLGFQNTRCLYQNLLPKSEVPSLASCLQQKVFVDPDLHSEDPFFPQIKVSQNLLNILTEKLNVMGKSFLTNRPVSTQALFEEISPVLGKYYRRLRQEFNDPEESLEALWGNKKNDVDYSFISSLLDHEEWSSLPENKSKIDKDLIVPEEFSKEYRKKLISGEIRPLDRFIRRHNQRKRKNTLNLRLALKELKFLIQEGLTDSQHIREIVDFCHSLTKMKMNDHENTLIKEIVSLLSELPHPELNWLLMLEKHFFRADRYIPKDLISTSVIVLGIFMKQRTLILTESEKNYLFDSQGNLRKNMSLTGRSRVTYFPEKNPDFYLKHYPEWPGYELGCSSLMRLLGVAHLPYQDLLIINSRYPVLLTQGINGSPVHRVWGNPQAFNQLDPFYTGLLIISAMLINPEDGKEDNFILSKDGKYLIPIDNDHCFLPSTFQKEGSFWNAFTVNTALQTKTLLFCLDEMVKPIPVEVKKHLLSLNFDLLLTAWMTELDKLENKFNNLGDQNQRNKFLEQGTVMRIPFYKQFIQNIYWKAHKIQDLLKTSSKITPFDLLRAIEPFAARYYQGSFSKWSSLRERFQAATNQLYTKTAIDGTRVSILNTRAMMEIINISEKDLQTDAVYQIMGPFDCLELLKQLIKEHSDRIKKEKDLLCELDEKNHEKKWTNLFGDPPVETALKAFLANPKEGLMLTGSKLITSSKLKELFAQTPNTGMRIRFLSLPNSPLLTEKEIRFLATECPNLEYLNVSGCDKLKRIFTAKEEWPLLARLEAVSCNSLERFVSYSPMKVLRIEGRSLTEIFVEESTLDVFKVSRLSVIDIEIGAKFQVRSDSEILYSTEIITYILKKDFWFTEFFRNFKITIGKYSISSAKDLTVFLTVVNLRSYFTNFEDLQKIVALRLINLKKLNLSNNTIFDTEDSLKYLIQGDWPKLIELDLSFNELKDEGIGILAQGNWPLLETLNLCSTSITKKGLLNFLVKINWLNLQKIQLDWDYRDFVDSLLPKNWPLLEKLDLRYCGITKDEIEVIVTNGNWPHLKCIDLSSNETLDDKGFEILCQGDWPLLETLDVSDTKITKKTLLYFMLDIKWLKLREVKFIDSRSGKNFAENLFSKNWNQLQELDLSRGEITQTEIKLIMKKYNLPQLKHLNLFYNEGVDDEALEILAQADWPLLETLDLASTRVTKKAFSSFLLNSNWPNFREIKLSDNFDDADKGIALSLIHKKLDLVERLELENSTITLSEIQALLMRNKYQCPQLKFLNLLNNRIFGEGKIFALLVADCPLLEEILIENTGIGPEEIKAIVHRSKWSCLSSLDISNNDIFDEGISFLVSAEWHLLRIVNLSQTKLSTKGIEEIANESKWSQMLQHLNISNNEILDEGMAALTLKEWALLEELKIKNTKITAQGIEILVKKMQFPSLKKLDISENAILDEGLKMLTQGKWPLFEHLVYYDTKVTAKGHMVLLENFQWPNFNRIEHSFDESFYSENVSENVLAVVPMEYRGEPAFVTVLNATWLNSKEIYLSVDGDFNEKISILPRNKLSQFEKIQLHFRASPLKIIMWPPNLKTLEISRDSFWGEEELKNFNFFSQKCSLLENLSFFNTKVSTKDLEILISKSDWPNLKKLDLYLSTLQNEGLAIFASAKWPLLENIRFYEWNLWPGALKSLIQQSSWRNLKELDLSYTKIENEGIKVLVSANWPLLENLDLGSTWISNEGVQSLVSKSNWPNLKRLDISSNKIEGEGLEILVCGKWNLLEYLSIRDLGLTSEGIEILAKKSEWPSLRKLDVSGNEIQGEGLERLICGRWPLLEHIALAVTSISSQAIQILIDSRVNWPHLKRLQLAGNPIGNEGIEILVSTNWDLLEYLDLEATRITDEGLKILTSQSNWPNLKKIRLSWNQISDEGLEILARGKWPLLESLSLVLLKTTEKGITSLVNISQWPNLKLLDISLNKGIGEKGLGDLAFGKWPLLESLYLEDLSVDLEDFENLVNKSSWPNPK